MKQHSTQAAGPKFSNSLAQEMPCLNDFNTLLASSELKALQLSVGSQSADESSAVDITHLRVSDTQVPLPPPAASLPLSTDKTTLYSINGDLAFFTNTQVFCTATGLRAVSPSAARRLLPDIEIGPLHPGHILHRLAEDGKSWTQVQLKTITSNDSAEPRRSVSLPDLGSADFEPLAHLLLANGYLVRAVQPMLEVVEVAQATSRLTQSQRVAALRTLPESAPFFQALGDSGVKQVLQKELRAGHFRLTNASKPQRRPWATPLHSVRRSWDLSYHTVDKISVSGMDYNLPQVSIFEGVVQVGGEVVGASSLDSVAGVISWTRPLAAEGQGNGSWFEHGRLRVHEHGLSADGAVLLSRDAQQQDLPSAADAMGSLATVRASALKSVAGTNTTHAESGKGPSKMMLLATATTTTPTKAGDGTQGSYAMTLDLDPWLEDQDRPPATATAPGSVKAMPFASLQLDTQNVGGSKGLNVPVIRLPIFDQLQAVIDASGLAGLDGTATSGTATAQPRSSIGSLYDCAVNLSGRSEQMGIITMSNAALIAQLADPFPADKPFNLTFKQQLNSDIVLPMLFQALQVVLEEGQFWGAVFGFDPSRQGGIGTRYYVASAVPLGTHDSTVATRLAVSQAAVGVTSTAPALVTTKMAQLAAYSVEDLMLLSDYDDVKIHTKTQDLVREMILYHMKDADRTNLLSVPNKPTDLPYPLSDGLAQPLKDWLRTVYAPAVVAHSITQASLAVKSTWRQAYTAQEEAKVWYFFTGQGPGCLSRSKEYSQITQLAAQNAMKLLFTGLQAYLNSGGRYWAQIAIGCLTDPAVLRAIQMAPIEGGVNYANKFTNVLTYLDPSGPYASQLSNAIYDHAMNQALGSSYVDSSAAGQAESTDVVKSVFAKLVTAALAAGPASPSNMPLNMTAALQSELQTGIAQAEADLGLAHTGTADARLQAILAKTGDLWTALGQVMNSPDLEIPAVDVTDGSNTTQTPAASKSVSDRLKSWAGWNWAVKVVDYVLRRSLPTLGPALGSLKGILGIALMARLVFAATVGFSAWNTESPAQKSLLIESSASAIVGIVTKETDVVRSMLLNPDRIARIKPILVAAYMGRKRVELANALRAGNRGILPVEELVIDTKAAKRIRINNRLWANSEADAGFEQLEKVFSVAGMILNAVGILLSIASVISMSIDLANQWGSLNTWGKTLSTINIAVTALSILCNQLIVDILVAVDFAFAATMQIALPGIGAVLAVVGIVIAVLMFVFQVKTPPPPPPLTPIEAFIAGPGRALLAGWQAQPDPKLAYVAQPARLGGGTLAVVNVTGENKKTAGSSTGLRAVTLTFLAGAAVGSLFRTVDFRVVDRASPRKDLDAGNVYVTRADDVVASVKTESRDDGSSVSVAVTLAAKSPTAQAVDFKVLFGALVGVAITGVPPSGPASSVMQIVEDFPGDADKSGTFPVFQIA